MTAKAYDNLQPLTCRIIFYATAAMLAVVSSKSSDGRMKDGWEEEKENDSE